MFSTDSEIELLSKFCRQLFHSLQNPKNGLNLRLLLVLSVFVVVANCAVCMYVPLYYQQIVDNLALKAASKEFDWKMLYVFVLLNAFQGIGSLSIATCLQRLCWIPVEQHFRHQIQVRYLEHVHSMSWSWMVDQKAADLIGALENGADSILSVIEHLLYSLIPTILNIAVALLFINSKFGLTYTIIIAIQLSCYIAFTRYITEKRVRCHRIVHSFEDKMRQRFLDSVLNFETVKVFDNEDFEREEYTRILSLFTKKKYNLAAITCFGMSLQHAIVCFGILACSTCLIASVIHKNCSHTPGDYALLVAYLTQLNGPIHYLAVFYRELCADLVKSMRMVKYLSKQPKICNSLAAHALNITEGAVEFQNVCLAVDSNKRVLSHISFRIPPKTTMLLVGASGSGKTSITRLLCRLFEPTSGEIRIDGVNIKDVTIESLRQSIGIVTQTTALFNDSVRNNIRYGKLDASEHEIKLAATMAQIHHIIQVLPDGYDTIVGENGFQLSGGERQRIGIARAIIKNPKIIILDEPTSSLDSHTSRRFMNTLEQLTGRQTCLLITHQLTTAVHADNILVLKDGKIAEYGSHERLMEKCGDYSKMLKQQGIYIQ